LPGDDARSREQLQRDVASLLLSVIGPDGFALAGACAIREHALTDRTTADVDLFGPPLTTVDQFGTIVRCAEDALKGADYTVERLRTFDQFARLRVTKGRGPVLDIDLALNWRSEPPVQLAVGPVLSECDAVAGKLSAVYSRGEIRDFLDLDAIRSSGRWSDDVLLDLGREHDEGFDVGMFAEQLSRVATYLPSEAAVYGISEDDLLAAKARLLAWASELRDRTQPPSAGGPDGES